MRIVFALVAETSSFTIYFSGKEKHIPKYFCLSLLKNIYPIPSSKDGYFSFSRDKFKWDVLRLPFI